MLDPSPRTAGARALIKDMSTMHCGNEDCHFDDPDVMVEDIANVAVQGLGELHAVAVVLYAHGEPLLAEALTDALDHIAMQILRPYFERGGYTVEDIGDIIPGSADE